MRTRDYYQTEVVTAPLDATATDLAERMGDYAVGSVVIVDAQRRPVGIVTDRDLTCRAIAREAVPGQVRAADLMSQPLVTANADEPVERIVERMRTAAVRRVVVLRDGRLAGLVSLDDLGEAARRAVQTSRRRGERERRRAEFEETIAELRASVERVGRDVVDFVTREYEALRDRVKRTSGSSGEQGPKSGS